MMRIKIWRNIFIGKLVLVGIAACVAWLDLPNSKAGAAWVPKTFWVSQPLYDAGWESKKIWLERDAVAMAREFDALETDLPKELIKAVAWCESRWRHWGSNGDYLIGVNVKRVGRPPARKRIITLDWGLMQINDTSNCLDPQQWDFERIKTDPKYNLQAGVAILESKRNYVHYLQNRPDWDRIKRRYRLKGCTEEDMVLMAYNGFQSSPIYIAKVKKTLREKPWEKLMVRQMQRHQGCVRWTLLPLPRDDQKLKLAVAQDHELAVSLSMDYSDGMFANQPLTLQPAEF